MTYWRMTAKTQKHPAIEPGETVLQASYGLSRGVVAFANRVDGMPRVKVWNEEMGEAEGLAAPLKHTGVLALTDRRLLFFRKRFAIGRPKTIIGDWPLGQIAAIAYEADDNTVTVTFSDGSSAGLHSPANQWPHKLVEGFARLKNLGN